MAVRIQFRRGTTVQWETANPTLFSGELGYDIDTKTIKFGDGTTPWLTLPVAAAGDIMAVTAGTGLKYGVGTTNLSTAPGESGTVVLEVDTTQVLSTAAIGAKGDILAGTGPNAYTAVNVGTNGQALVANSSAAGGVSWATVTDPGISNGYISNNMLASSAVTDVKIATGAVTETKIGAAAVTSGKLAANSVGTANIIDANVTAGKLATDAVETAKIKDLNVTTGKLAANAVTSGKVDATVYSRGTISGFTASSAKIHIGPVGSPPTGQAGDVWFAY